MLPSLIVETFKVSECRLTDMALKQDKHLTDIKLIQCAHIVLVILIHRLHPKSCSHKCFICEVMINNFNLYCNPYLYLHVLFSTYLIILYNKTYNFFGIFFIYNISGNWSMFFIICYCWLETRGCSSHSSWGGTQASADSEPIRGPLQSWNGKGENGFLFLFLFIVLLFVQLNGAKVNQPRYNQSLLFLVQLILSVAYFGTCYRKNKKSPF